MKRAQSAMERLAAARPESLDPPSDAERRRRDIAGALAETAGRQRLLPRRTSRRLGLGLGLVAAGTAAVVVAVAALGGGSPRDPAGGGSRPTELAPHSVLLAAAEKAEAEPMGKYWYNDQVEAQTYLVKDGYAVSAAASEFFEWTAVKKGGGNLFYGRDLPARPLTKADEAAWRRTGSPKSFRVWSNDHWGTYTAKPGPWRPDKPQAREGGRFPFAGFDNGRMVPMPCPKQVGGTGCAKPVGYGATIQDLENLTTDPKQLATRFMSVKPGSKIGPNNAQLLMSVSDNLSGAPVPPKLRAAMMRMLPLLPGVHPVGSVTDPLGRPGFAVAADWPSEGPTYHGYGSRVELIFNDKGECLGEREVLTKPGGEYRRQKPGFVIFYQMNRSSGWTDSKPAPPKKLPY
ncbi:hypothetical protein GCM10027176_69590 [Actinoallomurus bryophytorum]|uniref:Uncharacterized protein n=1 Tax=Actinoallomurus bryophytorum TaxID=1490222 RepID=A0A543CU79_9ACTN|nr:CU044_5270 family protein [Actinoallomurus bryophytorum]TQM00652.1 hypothetical protein FB559_6368 [Actinoallomurus bryophytorum]